MADSLWSREEQTRWNALVAEAAKLAADDLHDRDDANYRQLLRADLQELHARLTEANDTHG